MSKRYQDYRYDPADPRNLYCQRPQAFLLGLPLEMRWVITSTIDPTKLKGVVTGRFGASVMFVWYSKFLRQWYWVYGGGHEEKIAEPQMLFLDEDWARENRTLTQSPKRPNPTQIRKKNAEQLELF